MRTSELTYRKYGTRIAGPDEANDGTGLQQFAYDGTRAMLDGTGREILPGPVERVPVGTYDGEDVYAYLWLIVAEGKACAWYEGDAIEDVPDDYNGPCIHCRQPRGHHAGTSTRPKPETSGGDAR